MAAAPVREPAVAAGSRGCTNGRRRSVASSRRAPSQQAASACARGCRSETRPDRIPGDQPIIRVLLADDQALVRAGFRALLDAQDGIEVVDEAQDGRRAVELARQHRPDVILMDIRMPVLDGLAAT